ncbi:MAG: hopanoid-associated sugar epimerase [Candidatus Tectimicrobiota bacterium]
MTTLVTGATGFIGANVVRALLDAGTAVRVLVRQHSDRRNLAGLPVEVVYGDLGDPASLRSALQHCQTLYHVAAFYSLWTPQPQEMYAVNVQGTTNLLQAAYDLGLQKVVYTSSVATIALPEDGRPGDETMSLAPEQAIGHYKRSKVLAEQVALDFCRQGLPLVVVNPAAPIGPWDIKPTPTGKILVDFLRRKMPAYLDTGLNLVDVRDVAHGHLLAAQHGKVGERYILGCQNMTLRDILQLAAELSGFPAPRWRIPYGVALLAGYISEGCARVTGKPPLVPVAGVRMARHRMYFTAQKAVRELGLPQSPVAEAMRQAILWFREHGYA